MTFIWGFILGLLRIKSKGMLLGYVIHVLADFTIGLLVLHKKYYYDEDYSDFDIDEDIIEIELEDGTFVLTTK